MELKFIVYITINLCNGKFYIGVHKTNPDTWDGYIGCGIYRESNIKPHCKGFHKAVKKYGYTNFKRTTIAVFPNTKKGMIDAYNLEHQIVTKKLITSKQCYNLSVGGKGSCNEEVKKPVYQFSFEGKLLNIFDSAWDAARFLNTNNLVNCVKAIRNNCLGTTKSSYGFYWSYSNEFIKPINTKLTAVAQYTVLGKFIRSFNSIAEAEETLQITNVYQAISKNYLSGGYQWRYFNNDVSDIEPLINTNSKNNILKIKMINKKTLEETKYNSVNECILNHPNLSASQINRVLTKKIKSHKGFEFEYIKDEDMI